MQVFISWSGAQSQALAQALREWLPMVIQSANPWFSPEDIDKGARWLAELTAQLDKQSVGIVCITPQNVHSDWLLFEAGALSKALEMSSVCPVLIGIEPNEVTGPLAQFQATRTNKDELRKLLGSINKKTPTQLTDQQIDTLHDALWPELEKKITEIASMPTHGKEPHRRTNDILNEVLTLIRSVERHIDVAPIRAAPDEKGTTPGQRTREWKMLALERTIASLHVKLSNYRSQRKAIEVVVSGLSPLQGDEKARLLAQADAISNRCTIYEGELAAVTVELAEMGSLSG